MRKIKLFLTALAMMVASVAFAQELTVTGTVTDASTGEPVPFASVHLEGTMNGTNTDADGDYSIKVPSNGVLVFSSIGYET
jgi:protocatechuate 3,4-dioxygenase beta subunit